MTGAEFLSLATLIGLAILGLALILVVVRIIIGPTLPDRVLALDALTTVGLGFVCVIAARTGLMLYLDIAIALALLGFLATIAFARYILARTVANRAEDARARAGEEG
jgi:multicomponent Na+:H+ antiporter subunit F